MIGGRDADRRLELEAAPGHLHDVPRRFASAADDASNDEPPVGDGRLAVADDAADVDDSLDLESLLQPTAVNTTNAPVPIAPATLTDVLME